MVGKIENHRAREEGRVVYPVYSRRSRGLSVGINLFPDRPVCSFACPYCEVFPFEGGPGFSFAALERDLRRGLEEWAVLGVRDLCFSGNGEPTMAPDFPEALERVMRFRDERGLRASLVVITNGTGLLDPELFGILGAFADRGVEFWVKADAGTEAWYREMNRSALPFGALMERIRRFTRDFPAVIQTMRCKIQGRAPGEEELRAWEGFITDLAVSGNLREVQIYGKVRPAPADPWAEPLGASVLEAQGESLRRALASAGAVTPVNVFP